MKIGLIYPSNRQSHTYKSGNTKLQKLFDTNPYIPTFFLPSLSLLTIAASTPADFEVKLIDERIDKIDFDEHFDVVGISIMTEQARRGYEISQKFRKRGVFTVMGGVHVSVLSEEALNYCDSLVIGEGEELWPQLLSDYSKGNVKRTYIQNKQINLEQSPIPRYDLVDTEAFNLIPTQTTRGCPHDCSFCTVTMVYGARFRNKDTRQVIKEIEAIKSVSNNSRIIFNDDNMFVNKRKTYDLLEAIIPLKIRYFAESDISFSEDEKLLDLAQKSGCVTVFIGFESLIPENLASLQNSKWKHKRLDQYSAACRKIQSHGIQVVGSFIVGFDHDDISVFQRLIDFTLQNNILGQYHFLTPFPGTRIRKDLIEEGRLPEGDDHWDKYSCFDAVFPPKKMSLQNLEEGLINIYSHVYSKRAHYDRSRHIIDLLKELKFKKNEYI